MDPNKFISCVEVKVPDDQASKAIAININPNNASRAPGAPKPGDGQPLPLELALLKSRRWPSSGVRLTVGFLDNPDKAVRDKILKHMNAWNAFCNVLFTEVPRGASPWSAQVRIARNPDGYWSYVGTDILSHDLNGQATMNLEAFSLATRDSEYVRVVRHETGHTLGFPHEHLRKEVVDWIDPAKAIQYFGQPPNGWDEATVRANVLTPLDPNDLIATATADLHSIMCYSLPPEIMKPGAPKIPGGTDITDFDRSFAQSVYPKRTLIPVSPPPIITRPPIRPPIWPPPPPPVVSGPVGRIPAWDPVNDVPEFGEPIGTDPKGTGMIINTNTVPVATEAVDIATSGGHVYQLCADGSIWRYTFVAAPVPTSDSKGNHGGSAASDPFEGVPSVGPQRPTAWVQVSEPNDGATVQVVADGQVLYKRLNSGAIFANDASKTEGWLELDNNPKTVDIVASNGNLYQRRTRGVRSEVLKYTNPGQWELLDEDPDTVQIVADADQLYKRSKTGEVYLYTGTPLTGWTQICNDPETVEITASGGYLYQRQAGKVLVYQGATQEWQVIGEDPDMAQIIADGPVVYERQKSGRISMSIGNPVQDWHQIDGNFATQTIAAGNGQLYQMHKGGRVLKFTAYKLATSS